MTANPFAALLRDVPVSVNGDGIAMVGYDEVLAALAAAVPADLAAAGKVLEGVMLAIDSDDDAYVLPSGGEANLVALPARNDDYAIQHPEIWQAMVARFNAYPALLARIAVQEVQIKGLAMDVVSAGCQAQEAYEAQKAAEAERDALATEKFKMRDERDKAKIAASNYAEFNHTWRTRAEAAETALAASEARVAKLVEAGKWAFGHIATLPMDEASQADFMRHRAAITEATQ